MVNKLKYKKELEKNFPLDYFLIEKIPILKETQVNKNSKNPNFKYIERHQALSLIRFTPQKPISKLLDPSDF